MAELLDGKRIADEIRAEVKTQVEALAAEGRRRPGLAVVLVGENPASQVYVGSKVKACQELGLHSERYDLPDHATTEELLEILGEADEIEERASGLHRDQEIDVALGVGFATGGRAEKPHVTGAMSGREAEDRGAVPLEQRSGPRGTRRARTGSP